MQPPGFLKRLAPVIVAVGAIGLVACRGDDATSTDVAEVVEQAGSAVVTVVNLQARGGLGGDDAQEAGRGTGFIIDQDGHIVTNEHVVADGDEFRVVLASGEARDASLVGADLLSDLAVLSVDGDLPDALDFADSATLRVGEAVLAIGSPLGTFTNTVTDGIVSGLHRDLGGATGSVAPAYRDLIQHNAAINPGNSGGPLLDLDGRVVGVNAAGIPVVPGQETPAQGLFFAIPANTARTIVDEIIETGGVTYPYLGVSVVPVTPSVAGTYDLPVEYGAFVGSVSTGSPAAEAGIEEGDFIVAIGGERIDGDTSFSEVLFGHAPGDRITITLHRDGDEEEIEVVLGERPANP